jgi:hypothetical protein
MNVQLTTWKPLSVGAEPAVSSQLVSAGVVVLDMGVVVGTSVVVPEIVDETLFAATPPQAVNRLIGRTIAPATTNRRTSTVFPRPNVRVR